MARTWSGLGTVRGSMAGLAAGFFQAMRPSGLAGSRPRSTAQARTACRTACLRRIVVAAARVPSRRSVSASSAALAACGSFSWSRGRDARCSHVSARTAAGPAGTGRAGLKACWYRASRCDGGRAAGLVRAGVIVARASATPARERGARCGHFIAA